VLKRKRGDGNWVVRCERTCRSDQSAIRAACELGNCALDVTEIKSVQFDTYRSHCLNCGELANARCNGRIAQYCRSRHLWGHFFEYLKPFRCESVLEGDKAGGVATWMRKSCDEA